MTGTDERTGTEGLPDDAGNEMEKNRRESTPQYNKSCGECIYFSDGPSWSGYTSGGPHCCKGGPDEEACKDFKEESE